LNGLIMKSQAPFLSTLIAMSMSEYPVIAITGTSGKFSFMLATNSVPLMPGSWMSVMTKSMFPCANFANASSPEATEKAV
jgi:hypothetical protein